MGKSLYSISELASGERRLPPVRQASVPQLGLELGAVHMSVYMDPTKIIPPFGVYLVKSKDST